MDPQTSNLIDTWVKVLGLIGGVVGFAMAFWRYTETQRWKILEFVASEVKEFDRNTDVQKAKKMLDWWEYLVELFPGKTDPAKRRVLVTDELVAASLRTDCFLKDFNEEEVEIRNIFDGFFDYLDRFDNYIESGLVSYEQFHPYLGYWLEIIALKPTDDHRGALRLALLSFVEKYHSPGTDRLVRRYSQYANAHGTATSDAKVRDTKSGRRGHEEVVSEPPEGRTDA